jgi:hypothetical protein
MLRIPHCLDNRLIDGGKVVSLSPAKTVVNKIKNNQQNRTGVIIIIIIIIISGG